MKLPAGLRTGRPGWLAAVWLAACCAGEAPAQSPPAISFPADPYGLTPVAELPQTPPAPRSPVERPVPGVPSAPARNSAVDYPVAPPTNAVPPASPPRMPASPRVARAGTGPTLSPATQPYSPPAYQPPPPYQPAPNYPAASTGSYLPGSTTAMSATSPAAASIARGPASAVPPYGSPATTAAPPGPSLTPPMNSMPFNADSPPYATSPPTYGPASPPTYATSPPPYGPTPPAAESAARVASRTPVEELRNARILAHVDGQPILAGEVAGMVNQVLMPRKDQMSESDYKEAEEMLTKRFLRNVIEMKMLFGKFVATIPPDQRDKALPKAWQQVNAIFEQQELPKLLEKAEVETAGELDAKYREYGYSLAKHRRSFSEKQLGTYIMMQNIDRSPEVTYDEMIAYYREHEADYAFKARARWEQLTVTFAQHPDRNEARRLIAEMGDAVFYGTPFAAVAKRSSEGFRAADGGLNDWAQQGSLASKPLDQAIFSLPLNQLSQVIEDDRGFHIIRVLDREPAGKKSFIAAQVEIKEKIQEQKRKKQISEFLEEVKATTTVTTIYDSEPEGPLMQRQ